MSNDKWRFDPNQDYTRGDDDDYNHGGRKGFAPMKHNKQHHNSGKFDGKRMKRDNHRRGGKW